MSNELQTTEVIKDILPVQLTAEERQQKLIGGEQ